MSSFQIFFTISILVFSFFKFGSSARADVQKVDELIKGQKVQEAKALLDEKTKEEPKNIDYLERKSRVLLVLGDQAQKKEDKLKLYEEAKETAEKILSQDEKAMMGYVRRAAANGKVALFKGILDSKDLVTQTKEDTEKAIQLNNSTPYGLALAHYILGRAHHKLSETPKPIRMPLRLTWGNIGDAEKNLSKAVELFDSSITFRVDYARVLIEIDKKEEAKTQLNAALKLPIADPGDPDKIKEAKEMLSRIP